MRFALLIFTVPLFAIEWSVGIVLAAIAFLCSPIIARFVDRDGNLPWGLRHLFQPVDNPCWGDASWIAEHPNASRWYLSMTYLARNAAYGYQSLVAYPLPAKVKTFGDLNIGDGVNGKAGWYLILGSNGAWEFAFIYPLLSVTGSILTGVFFCLVGLTLAWIVSFFYASLALYVQWMVAVFALYFYIKNRNSCVRGEYGWSLRSTALKYKSLLAGSLQLVLGVRFVEFRK